MPLSRPYARLLRRPRAVLHALLAGGLLGVAAAPAALSAQARPDPDLLWADAVPQAWNGEWPDALRIVPERTDYRRTTSSLDLHEYLAELKWRAEDLYVDELFISPLRHVSPVAVMADPRVRTPREAAASGKPVVFLIGNIHPPESEATEALLMVMRDVLLGDRHHLLDDLIIAVAPIYNVDGTDTFRSHNEALGAPTPVIIGVRENSQGHDLNRDGVKLETVEGNGLYAFMNEWDPLLFFDGHTMGRVNHAYANAYATSTTPAGDPDIRAYMEETLFPAVRDRVREDFDLEVYTHALLDRQRPPTEWSHDNSAWVPDAKFVVNDYGLRNRFAVIAETPGQPTFERRIYAHYAYILSMLEYVADHAEEMQAAAAAADEATVDKVREGAESKDLRNWVAGEYRSRGPIDVLWYPDQVTDYLPGTSVRVTEPGTPRGLPASIRVQDRTEVVGTEDAWMPRGYLIPAEFAYLADKLEAHGIEVSVLEEPMRAAGEQFAISEWYSEQVRGYDIGRLEGGFVEAVREFPAGTFFVDMAQPMANAAFYYLEPRSADGFVGWHVTDPALFAVGAHDRPTVYPVFKFQRELR